MNIFRILKLMREASPIKCYCSVYSDTDGEVTLSWKFGHGESYFQRITERANDDSMVDMFEYLIYKAGRAIQIKLAKGELSV